MPLSPSHSFFLLLAGLCCLPPGSQTEGYQSTGASGHNKKNQKPLQCQNFAPIITNISLFLLQNAMHWPPKQTNIVFSPVSIIAAFAMLSLGAKGSTHKQILKGLRFSLMNKAEMEVHRCFQYLFHTLRQPDHQLQVTTGNSLFINKHLRVADKFREAIRDLYHSEAIPINFRETQEAKTQINSHVMKRSYGQIKQMVDDLPIDTVLVLMNFISFSGIQNGEFQDEHTVEDKFHLDTGKVVSVPMINRLGKFDLHRDKSLSSWVLIQHYVGDAMVFFILPDLGKMQQLIESLSPEYLNSIQKHVSPRLVNLQFPKFIISATYDLMKVMRMLGITKIFHSRADLSKVTKDAPIRLSKAVHKAELRIEDRDTEVPEVEDLYKDLWPEVLTVVFNRTFLVIIKDETLNLPFFMAKVGDPSNYT